MPTGACGLACDVCKLKLLNICSSCGPGKSQLAKAKLEAQKRLLGAPCPILACASLKQVDYCLRDCDLFPCENFNCGPYPFSQSFLAMQKRRRDEHPPALTPYRSLVQIPGQYWEKVQSRDLSELCRVLPGSAYGEDGLIFESFQEEILLDRRRGCLKRRQADVWEITAEPQLELVVLLYLNQVTEIPALTGELITVADLKEAHYFTGPHQLPLENLLERYGQDLPGFKNASLALGGNPWRWPMPPLPSGLSPGPLCITCSGSGMRNSRLYLKSCLTVPSKPVFPPPASGSWSTWSVPDCCRVVGRRKRSINTCWARRLHEHADLAFLGVLDKVRRGPDDAAFDQLAFIQFHHIQGHPADHQFHSFDLGHFQQFI